jgi:hypothetical protein
MSAIKYRLVLIRDPKIITTEGMLMGLTLTFETSPSRGSMSTKKQFVTFVKPLKKYAGDKNDWPKGYFGPKSNPLTSFWIKLSKDYDNFSKEYLAIGEWELSKDPELIGHLNKSVKAGIEFIIGTNESTIKIAKLSLVSKFKIFIKLLPLLNKIKKSK